MDKMMPLLRITSGIELHPWIWNCIRYTLLLFHLYHYFALGLVAFHIGMRLSHLV